MSHNLSLSECPYCTHVDPKTGIRIVRTVEECEFSKSMYCYICMVYRHTVQSCPNKIACAIRRGESIEGVVNNFLEVLNTKKGIEDVLNTYKVPTNTKDTENRKRLRHLASSMNPPKMIQFKMNIV
jgi:type II secretory pathway component GspD/PulD (secretin)